MESVYNKLIFICLSLVLSEQSFSADIDKDGVADHIDAMPNSPGQFVFEGSYKLSAGTNSNDGFGSEAGALGDINDDGFPDFFITSPAFDDGALTDAGRVQIFSGVDLKPIYELKGSSPSEFFGISVSEPVDTNSDGTPDFAISNNALDIQKVFSGKDGSVLFTFNMLDDLKIFEDVTGNGIPEIYSNSRIYFDLDPFDPGNSVITFNTHSPRTIGDINDDNVPDFLLPAESFLNNPGAVSIKTGSATINTLNANGYSNETEYGKFTAALGDINNDSVPDFAISSNIAVYIYSGADLSILYVFTNSIQNEAFDGVISNAGDVDGDGSNDLITAGRNADFINVISGATGEYLLKIPNSSKQFGDSVAGVGDINGDGLADILVTSVCNGCYPGKAFILNLMFDNDFDGIIDADDPFPYDTDNDGINNDVDPDDDNDKDLDAEDNCPITSNYVQSDSDNDGIGNACDSDIDGDGINNEEDLFPLNPNLAFGDSDGDQIDDAWDNCPNNHNYLQHDMDNDGVGNICDNDRDGDNYIQQADSSYRPIDSHPLNPTLYSDNDNDLLNADEDNCPSISNFMQSDSDNDGIGDACDVDIDGDGVVQAMGSGFYTGSYPPPMEDGDSHPLNPLYYSDHDRDLINADSDNCPSVSNYVQSDSDGDGIGNACDPDVDGDGVDDVSDNYPLNPNLW